MAFKRICFERLISAAKIDGCDVTINTPDNKYHGRIFTYTSEALWMFDDKRTRILTSDITSIVITAVH
jgi:hypothetical protein